MARRKNTLHEWSTSLISQLHSSLHAKYSGQCWLVQWHHKVFRVRWSLDKFILFPTRSLAARLRTLASVIALDIISMGRG